MKKVVVLERYTGPIDTASILTDPANPLFRGPDPYDLACYYCEAVVAEGVAVQRLADTVVAPVAACIQCPDCGALSSIPSRRPS